MGDYKAARAVMTELEGLVDELQKYTDIPLRVPVRKPGVNIFQIGIGLVALVVGAVALYSVFAMKPIKPKPAPAPVPLTRGVYPPRMYQRRPM